jgi:type II secretory pathway component PulK
VKETRGTVLILALWALGLLTVFAVNLHYMVRQKITLLARLEQRAQLGYMAAIGVRQAIGVLKTIQRNDGDRPMVHQKILRFLYREQFRDVKIEQGSYDVSYVDYNYGIGLPLPIPGFTDEESRLNINRADRDMIQRLIQSVTGMEPEQAKGLAGAIVDWREKDEGQVEGFYGDAYYSNLQDSYSRKKAAFERLDELRLIDGMNLLLYERLVPFITVYGTGLVNVNTAPRPVLEATGLAENVINAFLATRSGPDGQEMTPDDFIFEQVSDPAAYASVLHLEREDLDQVAVLAGVILGTDSTHFRIISRGRLNIKNQGRVITCIYSLPEGKIAYWREQPGAS